MTAAVDDRSLAAAPALSVRDLSVEFPDDAGVARRVVDRVGFDVWPGQVVGIVGETGSGKSMTLRGVLDLVPAPGRLAGAEVAIGGEGVAGTPVRERTRLLRRRIGYVPQSAWSAVDPLMTIRRQFAEALEAAEGSRPSRARVDQVAVDALASVGIVDPDVVLDGYVHQLSGGMAQRVVIAMVQMCAPLVILADEPTTGLDVTVQREVLDLLARDVAEHQRALVIVSHDPGVIANYCDRVVVMFGGRTVEAGAAAEVLAAPRHPYTKGLIAAMRGELPDDTRPIEADAATSAPQPSTCVFADRCPIAVDACRESEPAMRPSVEEGVACHLT